MKALKEEEREVEGRWEEGTTKSFNLVEHSFCLRDLLGGGAPVEKGMEVRELESSGEEDCKEGVWSGEEEAFIGIGEEELGEEIVCVCEGEEEKNNGISSSWIVGFTMGDEVEVGVAVEMEEELSKGNICSWNLTSLLRKILWE